MLEDIDSLLSPVASVSESVASQLGLEHDYGSMDWML
jgi:hypothetical protein